MIEVTIKFNVESLDEVPTKLVRAEAELVGQLQAENRRLAIRLAEFEAATGLAVPQSDVQAASAAVQAAAPVAQAIVEQIVAPTIDDLRAALSSLTKAKGRPAAFEVLRRVADADSMAATQPEKYAAVIAAAREATSV